jgi:hypothetical protein
MHAGGEIHFSPDPRIYSTSLKMRGSSDQIVSRETILDNAF